MSEYIFLVVLCAKTTCVLRMCTMSTKHTSHTVQFTHVGVFYTPQATSESLVELRSSLTKLREKFPNTPIMLGGDFNLPGIDWDTLSHKALKLKKQQCELLLEISADFHLEQVNLQPTRGNNILELFFTSQPDTIISCTTGPGISDHDHLVIARVGLKPKQQRKKPRSIFLFKKADWPGMIGPGNPVNKMAAPTGL